MNSTEVFDDNRPLLFSISYRMLGSVMEAEDVVQEAYLRWRGAAEEVRSPSAYLSTVVTRLCIDRLRSARARREHYVGVGHLIFISIVGIDRATSYPYYRVKLDAERVIEDSPIPYTILRATQFYDLVLMALRFLERLPVMPIPRGFLGQPIDASEVSDRLVELALSGPAGRVQDIGGPEIGTLAGAARTYLGITGRRRRILEVPVPGQTASAFREGALVCPQNAYGKIKWEDFLRSRLRMPSHALVKAAR